MEHSKLSDHKFKKGKFITPFNEIMSELGKEDSWYYGRLPEYIWLALILDYYGRKEGLAKCYVIIKKLHQLAPRFTTPRLSKILELDNEVQQKFYDFIIDTISPDVIVPLTAIFSYSKYPCFSSSFCIPNSFVDDRIKKISVVMKKTSDHQTHFSTDIRFVVLYFELLSDRLHMPKEILDLILEYPHLSHDDEKMRMIRPTIRSNELVQTAIESYNENYLNLFWEEVSRMSDCELFYINIANDIPDTQEYITHMIFKGAVAHILHRTFNTEKVKLVDFKRYYNIIQEADFETRLFSQLEQQGVTIDNPKVKLISETINDLLYLLY